MTSLEAIQKVSFAEIRGWAQDDHGKALSAFQLSAQEILQKGHGFQRHSQFGGERKDWLDVCGMALASNDAQKFFESHFQPLKISTDRSLFTGYYEPQVQGSLTRTDEFQVPLYSKPHDLIAGQNYFTRKEIEQGALKDRALEICFLRSWPEAYFIHIQGNGRVVLPQGKALRLSFAAKNGQAYKSIGQVLLARGIGSPQSMSMQFLLEWMKANADETRALLWENPSFIFFQASEVIDPDLGAIGAAKVPLTPLRSLAVDRSMWAFGTPLFLNTHRPPEAGGAIFGQLMIAQDTGSAIKGIQRGDVYWGWGGKAALNAGHMKSTGEMIALLPKLLANRLAP